MRIKNILLVWILAAASLPAQTLSKSYILFERAVGNSSTAPNFVLITVVNDKTKQTEIICTEAPFLLGAIHREYSLSYKDSDVSKANSLALAQKDRVFHFSRSEALNNLTRYYTEAQLAEMRTALRPLTDEDILKGLRGDGKNLDKLYMGRGEGNYSSYRGAIAHVLLERDLLPRRGCIAGWLTVER